MLQRATPPLTVDVPLKKLYSRCPASAIGTPAVLNNSPFSSPNFRAAVVSIITYWALPRHVPHTDAGGDRDGLAPFHGFAACFRRELDE